MRKKGLINCHTSAEKCTGAPNSPLFSLSFARVLVPSSARSFPPFSLYVLLTAVFDAATRGTYVLDNKYGNARNCSIDQPSGDSYSFISRYFTGSKIP